MQDESTRRSVDLLFAEDILKDILDRRDPRENETFAIPNHRTVSRGTSCLFQLNEHLGIDSFQKLRSTNECHLLSSACSYQILVLLQGVTRRADAVDLFLHLSGDHCLCCCLLITIRGTRREFFLEQRQKGLRKEQRSQLSGMFDLAAIDVRRGRDRRIGTGVRANEIEENEIIQRFVDQSEFVDDAVTACDVFRRITISCGVEE